MAHGSGLSNSDAYKLLVALDFFEQLYGKTSSTLELQAIIGALATVMGITNQDSNTRIHQVTHYQQINTLRNRNERIDPTKRAIFISTVQQTKTRLDDAEATLILLIRTYLQRVSSKLSAAEFVDLTKVAIALLHSYQKLSLPESKRLLYIALQTFGGQLSQPIPTLGEKIPKNIARLVIQLVRYQKIMRDERIKAVLQALASQTLESPAQRLTPNTICEALKHSDIAPKFTTQDGLKALANVLFLTLQLQTPISKTTKSEQEIAEQIDQAVTKFRARYRPIENVLQPRWNNELSISSPFFTPSNFEGANSDFSWPPQAHPKKTSKDETNS